MAASTSEVKIANLALTHLGQTTITSLTDDSRNARVVNQIYDQIRDQVLNSHPWNEAMKRASLPQLSTAPEWGFDYAYQLPSDFIRLAWPEFMRDEYRIEGDKILSNNTDMNIVYVSRITDPAKYGPLLTKAMAASLAVELALPFTGSSERRAEMERWFKEVMAEARYMDSQQSPVDQYVGSDWLDARRSGHANSFRPFGKETSGGYAIGT